MDDKIILSPLTRVTRKIIFTLVISDRIVSSEEKDLIVKQTRNDR